MSHKTRMRGLPRAHAVVALVALAWLVWLSAISASAADKAPKCEDRDVQIVPKLINGEPYYALVPNAAGVEGCGIQISGVVAGEKKGKVEHMEQADFDAFLEKAKAYRSQKLGWRKLCKWPSTFWFVQTAHWDLGWDITKISSTHGLAKKGDLGVIDAMMEYAERAERIWNDYEAVFGPQANGDFGGPLKAIMHDTMEGSQATCRYINKKETHPGPTRDAYNCINMQWNRPSMPTDNDLWENFTHNMAGSLAIKWRGAGKFQGSIPGWLDEGISFYLTRNHRELDTHTTIMFVEQILEQAAHIDGAAWKGHAKKVADTRKDDEVRKLFDTALAKLTQDDRIIGWSIVCFMIEYSFDKAKNTLMVMDTDKKKSVDLAEWMADPTRWDINADGKVDDEEKTAAEREFEVWDLNKDGKVDFNTEIIAHAFRHYFQLQKGGNAMDHVDALQRAFGWTTQDLMERWRAWLDGRPFAEKGNVDLSSIPDWNKFKTALRAAIQGVSKDKASLDESKCARYLTSLMRWQSKESVAELYAILESFENRVEKGEFDRPLKLYQAGQAIVANLSNTDAIAALFDLCIDGKGGKNLTIRNTLLRGIEKNKAASSANNRLAQACGSPEYSIRVTAIDTLGARGVPLGADAVVDSVRNALKDEVRAVRSAACAALVRLANRSNTTKFGGILDSLAMRMFDEKGTVRDDIYKALKEITGDDVGPEPGRWQRWVQEYKAAVARGDKDPKPKIAGPDPKPNPGSTVEAKRPPTYLGDEIRAKQIVFVVDRSYSMTERLENKTAIITGLEKKRKQRAVTTGEGGDNGQAAPDDEKKDDFDWSKIHTKWDLARESLVKTLKELNGDYVITIVLFDHRIFVWQPKMVRCTPENIKSAIDWVCNQPNPDAGDTKWGLTNIYDAIAKALEMTTGEVANSGKKPGAVITDNGEANLDLALKGAEEIRFLTDGHPTDGTYTNAEELLAHIRDLNRTRKVRINVYGIGQHEKTICRRLAEENNGKYEDWTFDSGLH